MFLAEHHSLRDAIYSLRDASSSRGDDYPALNKFYNTACRQLGSKFLPQMVLSYCQFDPETPLCNYHKIDE